MELLAVYYVKDMSQLCTVTVALHRASMSLLGAFVTLCKATISFIMSVHTEQLCSQRTEIHEILYLRIAQKLVDKIKVSLKSDKSNRCFT
jgi:hypothetical protein